MNQHTDTAAAAAAKKHPAANGGKWCRPTTRLAIYLRDGLACVYCGAGVEDETRCTGLTLDHVTPHSRGGSNDPSNLVTACRKCNSARQARTVREFARGVAEYLQTDADAIVRRVRNATRRKLDRAEARRIIARREAA